MPLMARLCEGVIEAGWLAALAVTPVLFNPYAKQNFEAAKVAALRSIVIVMIAAWLVRVIACGRARKPGAEPPHNAAEDTRGWRSRIWAALRTPLVMPAAAVIVSLILSTALAIDRGLSFWGSHTRFDGLLTQMSYLAVFFLVLTHLRTSAQWRRIAYVAIVTSVPVALYAMIQRAGIDPIVWPDVDVRVGSTLGNPIFLGSYLIMVFFITVNGAVEHLRVFRTTPNGDARTKRNRFVHCGLLVGAATLQLTAMVLSQSRGPMLGLVAGCLVFFPTAWLLLRRRTADGGSLIKWSRLPRRARTLSVVAACLILVVSATIARPQLVQLATRTGLARIAAPLSLRSLTARTRMMIWRGALTVMKDTKPLRPAHGDPDPQHRLRPLIGYGPETFGLALNRHLPGKLVKWEEGENTPDRAHNSVLETLVTTGLIGLFAWTALYVGVFYYASSWLGLLKTKGRRAVFLAALSGGVVLGALGPALLWDKVAASAAGMVAGAVFGLIAFLIVSSALEAHPVNDTGGLPTHRRGLILSGLALIVANLVETQFGIALAVTNLYLWVMLAVVVVVGLGWMDDAEESGAPAPGKAGEGNPTRLWTPGILFAAPAVCLVYGFLSNWNGETSTAALVKAALFPDTGPGAVRAALWFTGWLFAMFFASHLWPAESSRRRPRFTFKRIAGSVCLPGLYLVVQCARLTWTIRARGSGVAIMSISEHIANHFSTAVWSLIVIVMAAGLVRAVSTGRWSAPTRPQMLRSAVAVLVVGSAAVVVISRVNLDPVRADTLLKHGVAATDAGRTQLGLDMIERAAALAPHEPLYLLHAGRALMTAARPGGGSVDMRKDMLIEAEKELDRARMLAPLDPDHTANIARCLVVQSAIAEAPSAQKALRSRAAEEYSEALRLRSTWPRVLDEYAGLLRSMGRPEDADELARKSERLR